MEGESNPELCSNVYHQNQQQLEQEEQEEQGAASLKDHSKLPSGWLRESPSFGETEDNEGKGRNKPARRPLRCQVDGCGVDLSQARKYFQRYRVCERHLKAPTLQMDGHSVRFCDQCSKFHDITMFEGNRRTCNEKLERTRQARSDKRRQQTEQAERAAMRAKGGWRSRMPAGKRHHGDRYDPYDDPADEEYELEFSGFSVPKRTRSLPPPQPQLPAAGPAALASLSDQLEAQGILALHRATLAAAVAGDGAAAAAAAAAAAGEMQPPLHTGAHHRRVQGAAGSNDGGAGAGAGGASSLSSWDDGQPHLHLLRVDSISSRPGGVDGSQGHGNGTSYMLAGAGSRAADGGGGGHDAMAGFLNPYASERELLREEVQRRVGQGLRPGGVISGLTAAQVTAMLHELHNLVVDGGGAGVLAAVGSCTVGGSDAGEGCSGGCGGRGLVSLKGAGPPTQDARCRAERSLMEILRGGDGGGGSSGGGGCHGDDSIPISSSGVVGSVRLFEAPGMPALSTAGRMLGGGVPHGGGGGCGGGSSRDQASAAILAAEQHLLSQIKTAAAAGNLPGLAPPSAYIAAQGPRGGGVAALGLQRNGPSASGGGGGGGGLRSSGGGDRGVADDAAVAALRALVASRLGSARPQQQDATDARRGAGRRRWEEALGAAELLLSELGAARAGGAPALRACGGNSGAAAAIGATGELAGLVELRAPVVDHEGELAAPPMMPVLDLRQTQGPGGSAAAELKLGGGVGAGAGDDAAAWKLRYFKQQQQQHMMPQRAQASDLRGGGALPTDAFHRLLLDHRPQHLLQIQIQQQQEEVLLLQQQQQQQRQKQQQHEPELRQQQLQQQLQELLMLSNAGCGGTAAAVVTAPGTALDRPLEAGRASQLQRELERRERDKRAAGAEAARHHQQHHQHQKLQQQLQRQLQQLQLKQGGAAYSEGPEPRSLGPREGMGSHFRQLQHLQDRLHQLGVQVVLQ